MKDRVISRIVSSLTIMEHKSASTLEKKIRFGQSTKLFRQDNKVEDLWKDHCKNSGDEFDSVKHGKG